MKIDQYGHDINVLRLVREGDTPQHRSSPGLPLTTRHAP
jgi:hypothetical protein